MHCSSWRNNSEAHRLQLKTYNLHKFEEARNIHKINELQYNLKKMYGRSTLSISNLEPQLYGIRKMR
jgi:hypothetical protein